jgi:hypothetical protein
MATCAGGARSVEFVHAGPKSLALIGSAEAEKRVERSEQKVERRGTFDNGT